MRTISVHHQILPIFTTTCSGPAISQCDGSYDVFFSYYVSDGSDLGHRILLSTAPLTLQSAAVYSCGGLNTGVIRARFDQRPALPDASDHCNTYYDGVCDAEEKGNEFPYFVHVYLL